VLLKFNDGIVKKNYTKHAVFFTEGTAQATQNFENYI